MNFKQFFTSFYLFSKKYAKSIPLLIVLVIFVGSLFLLNGSQKSEKTVRYLRAEVCTVHTAGNGCLSAAVLVSVEKRGGA